MRNANVPVIDWEREFLNIQWALASIMRKTVFHADTCGLLLALSLNMRWTAMQSRLYKDKQEVNNDTAD